MIKTKNETSHSKSTSVVLWNFLKGTLLVTLIRKFTFIYYLPNLKHLVWTALPKIWEQLPKRKMRRYGKTEIQIRMAIQKRCSSQRGCFILNDEEEKLLIRIWEVSQNLVGTGTPIFRRKSIIRYLQNLFPKTFLQRYLKYFYKNIFSKVL